MGVMSCSSTCTYQSFKINLLSQRTHQYSGTRHDGVKRKPCFATNVVLLLTNETQLTSWSVAKTAKSPSSMLPWIVDSIAITPSCFTFLRSRYNSLSLCIQAHKVNADRHSRGAPRHKPWGPNGHVLYMPSLSVSTRAK